MNEELKATLALALQSEVNECISGLFSRLDRVESLTATQAEQIWKLQKRMTALITTVAGKHKEDNE